MRSAKISLLLLCFCILTLEGYAQLPKKLSQPDTLAVKIWTVEDGLPINTLNDIVQDDDGYIWFTSYDGIVRFDGLEFKTYNSTNTPEMPHNRATEIHKQDGVGMWISLEYGGVLFFNNDKFTHYGEEDGFSKSDITQIYEDQQGRMFFITHDGHYLFENNKFSRFFQGKDEQQNRIRFLFEDEDDSKWLATNNGLIHQKNNSEEEFNVSQNQPNNQFFSVFRNSEGLLLAGSSSGLFVFKNGDLISPKKYNALKNVDINLIWEHDGATFISSNQGIYLLIGDELKKINDPFRKTNESYNIIMVDSDCQLWMIGDQGTLSIYKDQSISNVKELAKTGLDYFKSIFQDREGNIWITTPREGIVRIKKAEVLTIGLAEGLSEGNILGLLKDSKGRYWVGTRGAGLNLIEGNRITYLSLDNKKLSSNVVQSIAEDSLGNIWLGNNRFGLNKVRGDNISELRLGEKFDINNVHALYTTSDGQLWAGSYGGLVKLDPTGLNHVVYREEDGLSGVKIRYITEATDGSLWIGTLDGGLSRFKNDTFYNYTTEQGLSSDNIRSIYIDKSEKEETVWVGTENNGLNRIKGDEITYISTEDGLPSYNIHWISEDDKGWLWMSTNSGVLKILKSSLNEYLDGNLSSFIMFVYGRDEGMRNPEGNGSIQEAGIKNDNGSFWFATQEGVAIIDNKVTNYEKFVPKITIRRVTSRGEVFPTDSVIVSSHIHDFVINIHAISFINPEETRFRYRFFQSGKETQDWVDIGKKRDILFSDAAPGEYSFEVQATDQNGVWMERSASLYFMITPKYYEQIWFYFLCVIVFSMLLVGGWKLRYKRLIQKQNRMEKIINEQVEVIRNEKDEIEKQKTIIENQAAFLEQSNKTKDKFFSIIAHDLRNPFQALLGYSDFLHGSIDKFDRDEIKEGILTLKETSKTLLTLTENLLEWANIQTGKVEPDPVDFIVNDLVKENELLFRQVADQKGINISVESISVVSVHADYNMINTVIRNLISNAIKFTESGGSIKVKLERKENTCIIAVSDTGIGMNEAQLNGIMGLDNTSTRRGTDNEAGTGLGLVLCAEMVEMNKGKLEISSEEGKGSTFQVELPCF